MGIQFGIFGILVKVDSWNLRNLKVSRFWCFSASAIWNFEYWGSKSGTFGNLTVQKWESLKIPQLSYRKFREES